jgi:hypothetical protein
MQDATYINDALPLPLRCINESHKPHGSDSLDHVPKIVLNKHSLEAIAKVHHQMA